MQLCTYIDLSFSSIDVYTKRTKIRSVQKGRNPSTDTALCYRKHTYIVTLPAFQRWMYLGIAAAISRQSKSLCRMAFGAWFASSMIWGEMQRCLFLIILLGLAADAGGHSTGLSTGSTARDMATVIRASADRRLVKCGTEVCIECEAGSYFSGDNSECLPCLKKSMSPAGSSALTDCRCNAQCRLRGPQW